MKIHTRALTFLCFVSITSSFRISQGQGTWTQKANFGGVVRTKAVSFSIGTKGYMGTGDTYSFPTTFFYADFWEWDQTTGAWTQKADFGGGQRTCAVGFSIGSKGYIGVGQNSLSGAMKDFWEYDPATNIWTQKPDFAGTARTCACGFSIGNKGYIGLGTYTFQDDFWEYDPINDNWTQRADFGGGARRFATGFSIGTKGYIGTGQDNQLNTLMQDFWEYDPSNDIWTQKANFGGPARQAAVGFSIGNKGFIGTGLSTLQDFWEYDAATNTWTQKANFGGIARYYATGFSIGCMGYIGTGSDYNNTPMNDFWEYFESANPSCCILSASVNGNTTICAGQNTTLTASGGLSYLWNNNSSSSSVILSPGTTTTYSVIASVGPCSDTVSITVIVNPAPIASITGSTTVITGNSTTLTASGGGNYVWSTGSNDSVIVVSPVLTTTYCITVTDINNCTDTACFTVGVKDPECSEEIFLPNAFSPNEDLENDTLRPFGIKCIKTFSLIIYNRWWERVFETTDPTTGWDGKFKRRAEATGLFTYFLSATYINGDEVKMKGNISLIR